LVQASAWLLSEKRVVAGNNRQENVGKIPTSPR